jgi:thiamine pyrophosphokinase
MNTCYIVGAGEIFSYPTKENGDLIIAADGGYDHLISHGITPDLLIGDLDSIRELPTGVELIRYPERKDDTDTFLAFKEGFLRGYRSFEIYGGVGGRDDHTFANISLLLYARKKGAKAVLKTELQSCEVFSAEERVISSDPGAYFSVFAIGGDATVSIEGAEYNLEGATLTPDFPLGVSNKFKTEEVKITVTRGSVLVFY